MPALLAPLREAWDRLSGAQRVRLVLAVVGLVGLVWGVSLYATRVRYGVLFSHLDTDDAAQVMAALRERQVPYRVAAGGTVIEVPAPRVDELRIELAGEGLPRGGGVGFEIFDKPAFGMSDFVQNVNYRRALERELARSIQTLEAVESARVHLALPRPSVFADEAREPSASVIVRLRGGSALPSEQARAIAHLVASGVDGLEPRHVSIVDAQGRMLHAGGEAEPLGLSGSQLEAKRQREREIERTLVSILEPVVGRGRVRASATVELDYRRVERVEETFDPESAVVRSEVRTKTRSESAGTGGVPGTASNLPDEAGGPAAAALGGQESQSTTTNFEVAKTVETIEEPVGRMVRQSVAVIVDHALVTRTDAQGATVREMAPRSEEEMNRIRDIVRAAVGYDAARGDVLIVENVPFEAPPEEPVPGSASGAWLDLVPRVARYAALPAAVLLIILLVVRPGIAVLRELRSRASSGTALPATVAELQARLSRGELSTGAPGAPGLRGRLIQAAAEDPQAAALVVRSWLREDRSA